MQRKYIRGTLEERLWGHVDKSGTCWTWTGATDRRGYGVLFRGPGLSRAKAHRISWELANGEIPAGLWVLHKCDNPSCVRPDHLFLGTHDENMADMRQKGRKLGIGGAQGERVNTARLTPSKVTEIRSLYAQGNISQKALAERFSVAQNAIWMIVNRASWKHVP